MRHLPEKADQCLSCACANGENLAAQELLLVTNSATVRGVVAALFIAGLAEHGQIVALARDAISEQRQWCDRKGPFRADDCLRRLLVIPVAGGDSLVVEHEPEIDRH